MKIDLHVHSSERSCCGNADDETQIEKAIEAGLDGIAFTDHDKLVPAEKRRALQERFAPFLIFGGIEVTVGSEHLLVYGVQDEDLESGRWRYPDLHRFVRQREGFLAVAHPFRFRGSIVLDLEQYPPDAIEVASTNTPEHERERIETLAKKAGIKMLCNSDAHYHDVLGKFYNILPRRPKDDADLVVLLRTEVRCGTVIR